MRLCLRGAGLLFLLGGAAGPQSDTRLLLRVEPEASLNLSAVALQFTLPGNQVQTELVEAKARPLPNQHVILTADSTDLKSANGSIPRSAIRWTGAKTAARGGGNAAACTSGGLAIVGKQALATGWTKPGILTCSVAFSIAEPERYPPGVYTGTVLLDIQMR